MNLANILKDSDYKLSQFTAEEIDSLEQAVILKQTKSGEAPYVSCLIRHKEIRLSPEEIIRQLYLRVLTDRYQYPTNRIRVEYEVSFGREKKRADIAVMDKDRPTVPYMIVELKKPKLKDGKDQLRSYCNATGSPIAVWTNGDQISHYHRKDPNYFEDITDIPNANQTLADILNIRFTLADLIKKDKLVTEKKSLKTLIQEMEDEVLANAGVDVFEELFKLIFTKLFDEWESGRGNRRTTRVLEFRNTGQTEGELRTKIQGVFDRAKKKWQGVFKDGDKISLSPSHLSICVSSLENVKLFNSNLDVVDEAFEYLINQTSKGEKGQYFTPRYVIDMCVKMLNPQAHESLIDTAAGSSGFPVHAMFYVWRQIYLDEGLTIDPMFSADEKLPACEDYVTEKVFAIDFDEKAVRVARTLNLIAGDGQTNVLYLNTLDYEMWDERIKDDDWRDVYNDGFKRLRGYQTQKNDYKAFKFDLVMANPPFAGEIKEQRITAKYDLALKPNGKRAEKMGRDILFIERNLDFLKPGGRMAVVLPQGRFNNSSDKHIRDVIAERCRILAVVGLHGNTFKPHTGTKTSVLFVQKWNDDPKAGVLCPKVEDYNIFFATMRKSGKDNSGDKIYVKKPDGSGEFLLDEHGHLMVDHDLFNHDGLTQDGIAEAFIEFAKKEKLSFFRQSPSVEPFDRAKYDRLMDGLEAAEVNIGEIDLGDRFDAEYFWKDNLRIQAVLKLRGTVKLGKLGALVASAFYPAATQLYEFGDTPFIRCVDCINYPLITQDQDGLFERIPYSFIEESKGVNTLNKGDLVITKVGSPCFASIIEDYETVALSRTVLGIKGVKDVDPYYLLIFLRSRYGFNQLLRQRELTIQYQLTLDRVKNVDIFEATFEFQKLIREATLGYLQLVSKSKSLYDQAEELLLSELGLNDWQPIADTIAVKRFSDSWGGCDRGDAEHYQPKFDQLIQKLKSKVNLQPLSNLLTVNQRGKQPNYLEEDEESEGLPVINSKHVREGSVILTDNRLATIPENDNALFIQKGDVLINGTGVGTIGRCAPYLYDQEALPDNHVTILRTEILNPVYLSIYLNSIIGQFQVEQYFKGSSGQIELYPNDIASFLIWDAPQSIQQKIKQKVEDSHHKREQSKQLLEIAKTGVERAIEEDEERAIAWMNQQLELLGIELKTGE
jgi:type I restriction enzyme M protein